MKLKIVSPEQTIEHVITWIEINTNVGNFIVQDGHVPMIVSLAENKEVTFCLENGKQELFTPAKGIVEITRSLVTLIISESPDV